MEPAPADLADLIERVSVIDFALTAGMTITMEDITVEEFAALRIVHDERDQHNRTQSARDSAMDEARQTAQKFTGSGF